MFTLVGFHGIRDKLADDLARVVGQMTELPLFQDRASVKASRRNGSGIDTEFK